MGKLDNELYYWQGLDQDDLPCHICNKPRWDCSGHNSAFERPEEGEVYDDWGHKP